mgnify:CR=1 FL=1
MRKQFCPACNAAKHGIRSRVAFEHTCVPPGGHIGMMLPGGGHASFTRMPDAATLEAINKMVELAKKMKA